MDDGRDEMREDYRRYTFRKLLFIAVCVAAAFLLFLVSLAVGTLDLSVGEVYRYLVDHITGVTYPSGSRDAFNDNVVWNFRVPRALFAIFAGVCLSVAGSVMQSVMRNPLADPYTTGVSSGAVFGMALAAVMGFSITSSSSSAGAVVNAIVFSLIPVAFIVAMAPYFRRSPSSLILSGVAVSYLFSSLTSLMLASADSDVLSMVYKWQVGSLSDLQWEAVYLPFAMMAVGMAILLPLSNKINIMSLDDKDARSLGLDVEKLRVACLVLIAVMTSVTVCYVGLIGFVGLVIPHIVRLLLGSDAKFQLPASGAFGAVFLLGCDIVSRSLDVGASVPVGVVTAFVGSPIFLFLIIQQRRSMWRPCPGSSGRSTTGSAP